MIFHHGRLASVFYCPESIPVLWRATTSDSTPATQQPRSITWRTQIKAFRIISANARQRLLKAVGVVLLCGFNHHKGSADVTSIIVQLLEQWHVREASLPHTYARYILDEAVEDALQGALVTYPEAGTERAAEAGAGSKRRRLD